MSLALWGAISPFGRDKALVVAPPGRNVQHTMGLSGRTTSPGYAAGGDSHSSWADCMACQLYRLREKGSCELGSTFQHAIPVAGSLRKECILGPQRAEFWLCDLA